MNRKIVDMALMGHLDSDAYIGAIALGSLIFNFIYWGLGFLRMGNMPSGKSVAVNPFGPGPPGPVRLHALLRR